MKNGVNRSRIRDCGKYGSPSPVTSRLRTPEQGGSPLPCLRRAGLHPPRLDQDDRRRRYPHRRERRELRVIDALAQLEDGAARELTPRDILENVVVKIADEVEVDVSTHAWKITYFDALRYLMQMQQ